MPVYDYRCTECNATYDVYHKGKEVTEDIVCPKCASTKYKKLMSASMVTVSAGHGAPSGGSCDSGGGCCGGACGLN